MHHNPASRCEDIGQHGDTIDVGAGSIGQQVQRSDDHPELPVEQHPRGHGRRGSDSAVDVQPQGYEQDRGFRRCCVRRRGGLAEVPHRPGQAIEVVGPRYGSGTVLAQLLFEVLAKQECEACSKLFVRLALKNFFVAAKGKQLECEITVP